MTIQTLTVILCSLVMICSRKIGVEATVFTKHLNEVTWESARIGCALKNATLAATSLSRRNGLLLMNDMEFKLDANQDLWVGYVKQFNYFMFKGCVSESTFARSRVATVNIVWCYNYCNTSYVGGRWRVGLWECFCMNSTPNWNTLVDCLGHTIMIFEHVQPEPFSIKTESIEENYRMCGTIWVQSNTAREIKMDSCHPHPQTWCEKNSTISMGRKCNAELHSWIQSIQCCTVSRLPQVLPTTIKNITFNIPDKTKTYIWTALIREWIVIDHKTLQGALNPESKCAYVMEGASGQIELHVDNCTTNRRYICSDYTGPTPAGASPKTSVVTSLSTSSLSSYLSSSVSTEGISDIISDASSKDEEKTRNWIPLVAGISGAVVGLIVIIIVVFLCWKGFQGNPSLSLKLSEMIKRNRRSSKRRTTVATTDQVVHGQEGSLPLNDTVNTYEGLIGASVMTRPDSNNYDVPDVGINDTDHTYEEVIEASVMTRPDSNNYDVPDVGINDTDHTYEGLIGASVMTRPDSNNYDVPDVGINDTDHTYEEVIEASVMTRPDSNNYDVPDVGINDTEHTCE